MNDFYLIVRKMVDGEQVEEKHYCHQIDLLLSSIDKIYDETEQNMGYAVFGETGKEQPNNKYETVLIIEHEGNVICPESAGGNWGLWDAHRKMRNGVISIYEKFLAR